MSSAHTNCNTSNVPAECRSSKKKIGTENFATSNAGPMYCRLQSLESKHVYQQIRHTGGQILLTHSALDYAQVDVPEGSVIYCDIPYKDTNVYNKGEDFDYPRFYHWAMSQRCPVYISSYWMPDAFFECVMEWTHKSIYCATEVLDVTERLFLPRKGVAPYPYSEQLSLDL